MVNGDFSAVARDKRRSIGNFLLPNSRTYIVAGDSAEVRVFLSERRFGEWTEVTTLDNPDARVRERDRVTDRPGRAFDSFGKGRHAMATGESAQQHDTNQFAHSVGEFLNKGIVSGDFDSLVLIADPKFLGFLRKSLSAASADSTVLEIPINPRGYDLKKLKSLLT
jgi:protein required for attachment to host cells